MHQFDSSALWGMFTASGTCVKFVIGLLCLSIILTWTIVLVKTIELFIVRNWLRRDLRCFSATENLFQAGRQLAHKNGIVFALTHTALDEWKQSANLLADQEGLKERVALCLERAEAAAGRHIIAGTGVLAIIGSTAPFVGLFGTVWGIMSSFINISQLHSPNLAVVAPGIAEALLATACGLIAAIPASVFYNLLSRRINAHRAEIEDAATMVLCTVSRDLSRNAHEEQEVVKLNFRLAAE